MANAEPTTKDLHQLVYITALVVVAVFALFLLHVLGSLRRRSSRKLLHTIVWGTYTLSYALVSYTLGLMQNSDYYFDEFPVWAVCLLMLLGGTDNLMACKLNDVDDWKSFHMRHLLKGALVVHIVAYYGQHVPEYQKPLWAILSINVLQSCVRIKSMRMASKSNLLSATVKPIADHMKLDSVHDKDHKFNPLNMQGCKYVVSGEHRERINGKQRSLTCGPYAWWASPVSNSKVELGTSGDPRPHKKVDDTKITTVEQIWMCEGSRLSSKSKDICLSMALSKMLNRRFAGFELPEAKLEKTHDFVFQCLLAGDKDSKKIDGDKDSKKRDGDKDSKKKDGDKDSKYERAFRVIEVELGFVYDLYYTRYPYLCALQPTQRKK
jgi:hypothetical protein